MKGDRGRILLAEIIEDSIPLFDAITTEDNEIIRMLTDKGLVECNGLAFIGTEKGHEVYRQLKQKGLIDE